MDADADAIVCSALRRLNQINATSEQRYQSTLPHPRPASAHSSLGWSVCTGGFRWPPNQREGRARGGPTQYPAPAASQVGRVRAASREHRESGQSPTRGLQPLAAPQPLPVESSVLLSAELSGALRSVLVHSAPPKMCAALQHAGAAVLQGWAQQVFVALPRRHIAQCAARRTAQCRAHRSASRSAPRSAPRSTP